MLDEAERLEEQGQVEIEVELTDQDLDYEDLPPTKEFPPGWLRYLLEKELAIQRDRVLGRMPLPSVPLLTPVEEIANDRTPEAPAMAAGSSKRGGRPVVKRSSRKKL